MSFIGGRGGEEEKPPRHHHHRMPRDARPILPKAAFFLGDMRDGLPMLNMQAVFLVSACNYTEKQMGILFLCFGLAQTLCMAPAGYFIDYCRHKIRFVILSALIVSCLTVLITLSANGGVVNMPIQVLLHTIQGGVSAIISPTFNGITMGITGRFGFTHQVSRNRFMCHLGTAALIGLSCVTAYYSYPNFEVLFAAAPFSATAAVYFLLRIPSSKIHRDAARSLIMESPTMTEYNLADDVAACKLAALEIESKDNNHGSPTRRMRHLYVPPMIESTLSPSSPDNSSSESDQEDDPATATVSRSSSDLPSFRCGWTTGRRGSGRGRGFNSSSSSSSNNDATTGNGPKARTPAQVLSDPILLVFTSAIFFFKLADSVCLPLVMQSLALQDPQGGLLLSGLCIVIAQTCMAYIAQWCGDLSAQIGRRPLMLLGLSCLTTRCLLLTGLLSAEDWFIDYFQNATFESTGVTVFKTLILSTQILDSFGMGIIGTLRILVTGDIAGGSGRFTLVFGVNTASMCLGATISGYLGQAVAQDLGYEWAFATLAMISLIPLILYYFWMPETLPDYSPAQMHRQERFREWRTNFHKGTKNETSTDQSNLLPAGEVEQGGIEVV